MDGLVAELAKNPLEKIYVAVWEFKGHAFVDIRLYFLGDDEQWHPTKRGITIAPDSWGDFLAALAKVEVPEGTPRPANKPGQHLLYACAE